MPQLKYWDGSAWVNAVIGAQGPIGNTGNTGPTGPASGFPYNYITTTTATDPGAGNFGFNSTTAASITQLYISETDGEAGSRSGAFVQWGASTTTSNKGTLSFTGTVGGGTATFTVTGASTDNGTWRTFPVSYVSGAFPGNTTKTISFSRTGDLGATGATGATGPAGPTGSQGPTGAGFPTGGSANQVLSKIDSTNYNTQWSSGPGAGEIATASTGFGYMGIPPSSAATTGAYTITASDAGEHIYSTATRTITIPANASVALPVGTAITFIAATGTTVTIAITSDTLLLAGAGTTGSRTLAPFGMATAIKITSTSWIISGNGLT